jgi:hypothetical protein
MGILDRLFGGRQDEEAQQSPADAAECIHGVLVPHWETVDDIGKDDRVTSYRCESCHVTFSREEGQRLQEAAARRLAVEEERIRAR